MQFVGVARHEEKSPVPASLQVMPDSSLSQLTAGGIALSLAQDLAVRERLASIMPMPQSILPDGGWNW